VFLNREMLRPLGDLRLSRRREPTALLDGRSRELVYAAAAKKEGATHDPPGAVARERLSRRDEEMVEAMVSHQEERLAPVPPLPNRQDPGVAHGWREYIRQGGPGGGHHRKDGELPIAQRSFDERFEHGTVSPACRVGPKVREAPELLPMVGSRRQNGVKPGRLDHPDPPVPRVSASPSVLVKGE